MIACNFCDKLSKDVRKMVTTGTITHHAAICNECVTLCVERIKGDVHTVLLDNGEEVRTTP